THPMIDSTSHCDGVFVEHPPTRERFPGVDDVDTRALHARYVALGQARDPAHPSEEVQRATLPREDGAERALEGRKPGACPDIGAVPNLFVKVQGGIDCREHGLCDSEAADAERLARLDRGATLLRSGNHERARHVASPEVLRQAARDEVTPSPFRG